MTDTILYCDKCGKAVARSYWPERGDELRCLDCDYDVGENKK